MREKKIFLYIVTVWFTLLGAYIYIEKTNTKIFESKKEISKITLFEAQSQIDTILSKNPISIPSDLTNLENNSSKTLEEIVRLLKQVESNIFVQIESHTNLRGNSSRNRIISQKWADAILKFIQKRYQTEAIDAIGYGEEFPIHKNSNNNERVVITLQPLIPKI